MWHFLLNIFCYVDITVESLQSHCIHTQFHWSSGPPVSFPSWGTQLQSPGGVLLWNQDSPVSIVSLHWWPRHDWSLGLVWGGLCPESSLGNRADNVIIPLDLTQLFCPGMLAAGPPSSFTTDIVGCWGEALWRACNLTACIHSSTGPRVRPLASHHEGPEFNPQRGTYVKPGFSCWRCLAT
jgi:hypothetical protein